MKTKPKTATIGVVTDRNTFTVAAYNDDRDLVATLLVVHDTGLVEAVPSARKCIEANGYTLPGAKWGPKGEILAQND